MRTEELEYDLPDDRIAASPAEPRDAARLMVCRRDRPAGRDIEHAQVRDLPKLGVLRTGDLMVVNRTRVLPALFEGTRMATGGHVRGLYLREERDRQWLVMLESRGTLRAGEPLTLGAAAVHAVLKESRGRGAWVISLQTDGTTPSLLERIGITPLPPYIRKARKRLGMPEVSEADAERYNTIYASEPGSVAAPTAGLHFTPPLLADLEAMGVRRAEVSLGVGLGTFEAVRSDTLEEHRMHREPVRVPGDTLQAVRDTRQRGGKVLVIGTTTARALESVPPGVGGASPDQPGGEGRVAEGWEGETDLFIYPGGGFTWRFTDVLMTNFHLPRSTLLAMVAALPGVGLERLRSWYREAIEQGYRFYSYGDAMLIV